MLILKNTLTFMQHPKQISGLDKFRQDFRNNQILGKYDKSPPVPRQQQKQQQQQQSHS